YGSVVMPREDNMAIKDVLLTQQLEQDYVYDVHGSASDPPLRTCFPVPSAVIHPGLVPLLLRDFGHDVVVNAGGGVHGHPMGAAAGGRAFRQAIQATLEGTDLQIYASSHSELAEAIRLWGVRT